MWGKSASTVRTVSPIPGVVARANLAASSDERTGLGRGSSPHAPVDDGAEVGHAGDRTHQGVGHAVPAVSLLPEEPCDHVDDEDEAGDGDGSEVDGAIALVGRSAGEFQATGVAAPTYSARCRPVSVFGAATRSAGGPWKTIRPPS